LHQLHPNNQPKETKMKRATMATGGDGKQRPPAQKQPAPTDKTKKK